mmetsp:Transcript_6388/g.16225  ORF Transcript_6388/g.16225 Transcript_6388/m.16225 type:complete len:135 (+) Transcript_6388:635-1039(+)
MFSFFTPPLILKKSIASFGGFTELSSSTMAANCDLLSMPLLSTSCFRNKTSTRFESNVLIVMVILFHLIFDWFVTFTPEFLLAMVACRGGAVQECWRSWRQHPRRSLRPQRSPWCPNPRKSLRPCSSTLRTKPS